MGQMSQEQINATLFDEVMRLKHELRQVKQENKTMENYIRDMRQHYDDISHSDHPLIHASNVEMALADFISDELDNPIKE